MMALCLTLTLSCKLEFLEARNFGSLKLTTHQQRISTGTYVPSELGPKQRIQTKHVLGSGCLYLLPSFVHLLP